MYMNAVQLENNYNILENERCYQNCSTMRRITQNLHGIFGTFAFSRCCNVSVHIQYTDPFVHNIDCTDMLEANSN